MFILRIVIVILPIIAAKINKSQTEIRNKVVAHKSQCNLAKERPVKVWVYNVGNQSEEEKECRHQQSRRIKDECELFSVFLFIFPMAKSECGL